MRKGNELVLNNEGMFINGERIEDILDYQLKSSAGSPTELTLKLIVSRSQVLVDGGSNDSNGNFS